MLGLKGWDFGFPSFENSILRDFGGVRSSLAEIGIGFSIMSSNFYFENLLTHSIPPLQKQIYAGQRPTFNSGTVAYVMADLSRYGIPDGQIVIAGTKANSTWQLFEPNSLSMVNLTYYQTFFNK